VKSAREVLEEEEAEFLSYTRPADGRRIMIEKMEFENFKSYYGKQAVGPFHKNFSAVVGPNGSGKSNVIDGILFVSGKRAKSLRQSKVT
jgi:structural maintenance of chromosome 4